ncbi:MAG: hypothetical protein KAH01_00015 [Caldisericia bacterium]|nr:hypothetical protein [Caldisericia bacterium]
MPQIAKTRIKVKMHRFICPDDIVLKTGDKVKISYEDQVEYGEVLMISPWSDSIKTDGVIIDSSSNLPDGKKESLHQKDREVLKFCQSKCHELNLNMSLVKVEHALDGSKIVIYFTADKRVDFRELVKEINNFLHHKIRIELWQISSREKAILIGGIGICGREVCCRCIAQIPDSVGIKTVKDQHLEINPIKITGICGKLMCCLSYEHSQYIEMSKEFPCIGSTVEMGSKKGRVKEVYYLKKTMKIDFEEIGVREITMDEYLGNVPSPFDLEETVDKRIHIIKPRTIRSKGKQISKNKTVITSKEPKDNSRPKKYNKKSTNPFNKTKKTAEETKPQTSQVKKPKSKRVWPGRRKTGKPKSEATQANPNASSSQKINHNPQPKRQDGK